MRMRGARIGWVAGIVALLCAVPAVHAQQPEPAQPQPEQTQQQEAFHWVDFHSEKDQPTITWVTALLGPEKWTAIREIGVQYDAALVVTTERKSPDASPDTDTFHLWNVSLQKRTVYSLMTVVHLRWVDPFEFSQGKPREPAMLYDDCTQCAATTYFTAFHYDAAQHIFVARWMRGTQGAPIWTTSVPEGVTLTQAYAVLPSETGDFLSTWNHFDYGKLKPEEDYLYRYDRDPFTGLERFLLLSGKDADAMKQRLCAAQSANASLARGQESPLCQPAARPRAERRPVTTPPANNQGRSVPPGSHPAPKTSPTAAPVTPQKAPAASQAKPSS